MLTPVPEIAVAVSAPRIAAIEYPLGRTLGQPGDAAGQLAVLRAVLRALAAMQTPGDVAPLPFTWPEVPKDMRDRPPEDPPIARYLASHPWELPRLLFRNPPHAPGQG